ncbi:hypothetical protein [Priestia megaterium]|uniref:hypothetical protein n=1 Tax=Priestia megaterium TaxID=1404 RepID=UPI0030083E6F
MVRYAYMYERKLIYQCFSYLYRSAFVLQKTIRDNEEDTAHERKYDKAEEEL